MAGIRDIPSTQPTTPQFLQDIYSAPTDGSAMEASRIRGVGDFGRGLRSAAIGSLSGAQRYVGANEAAAENQREAQRWAPEIKTTDQVDGFGTGLRYVLGATGEGVGSIVPALLGGVAGRFAAGARGAYGGAMATQALPQMGQHMQDQDANPRTDGRTEGEKRWRATPVGLAQAAVQAVPQGYMVNRLASPQKLLAPGFAPAVGRVGNVLATDAALEGGGAAAADVIGQASMMDLDPALAYNPNQTFQAGVREAVGGAGVGAVHAPLTVAHDYMNAGAHGVSDLAKRGARATPGVVDDALTAGKAGVAAGTKDLFRTSADFHAQHPELEGLLNPPTIPDSWATAPLTEKTAYMDNYEAQRNASARTMAERMLADENTSNADLHAARSLLESPDPKAWATFAKGVKARQVRDNFVDAIGSAASAMKRRAEDFGKKLGEKADLAGIKHNKESTPQDLEFRAALQPAIHAATGMGDDIEVVHNASLVLRDFVLGRFGDKDGDGVVDVPHGLVRAFGDNTAGLVAKAYDTLRRQGLTRAFDADAPMLLKEVNDVIKERKPLYKSAEQAVSDSLTPTALTGVPESVRSDLASTIAQYIDHGKPDERFEAKLDQWFGPNKEQVLSQIDKLHAPYRGTAKYGEDKVAPAYGDEGHGSDKAVDEGFESPTTNVEAGVNYHMGDGERPFDKTSPYYADNVRRAQAKLTDGSQATTYDAKAGSGVVRHEMISVGQHAKDSGDNTVMHGLMVDHKLSEKQVNERFQVMRTRDKMPDMEEPVDIKSWELGEPKNRDGKENPRSWADTESIRKMVNGKPVTTDTSTIAHGRIFLSRKSSDLVKSAADETLPKTFVTSAQKLIGKMLERKTSGAFDEHTAEMTGPQQKLAMFAAGLTSLMNSGKFHDEIRVKMPDGTMKRIDLSHLAKLPKPEEVRNGMNREERAAVEKRNIDAWRAAVERNSAELKSSLKSLPDDFVLYQGKDFKVTMKDALGTTDKSTRAWKQKQVKTNDAGKEAVKPAPTQKFEVSDIPTMTIDELREAYAETATKLADNYASIAKLKDGSADEKFAKLDSIRETLQAKLDAFEDAGAKRVDNRAPGDSKEQGIVGEKAIAGREVTVLDRDEKGHIFSKTSADKYAGANDTVVKRGDRWVVERDIGPKIETKVTHLSEGEEMADASRAKHDNKVRTHDESTGEELHPKQTLREKIAARKTAEAKGQTLREKIAEKNASKSEEQASIDDMNRAMDGEVAKRELDITKLNPRDIVWAVHEPKNEVDAGKFLKAFKDMDTAQYYAEKIGGVSVQTMAGSIQRGLKVALPTKSPYAAKDQGKSDKANKFIGRGSERSSTNAYATAWGDKANTGKYEATDKVFLSVEGSRAGRQTFDRVELNKAVEAKATIITDDASNRAREYNIGEREAATFLTNKRYTEVKPGEWGPKSKVANLTDARWARNKEKALGVMRSMSDEDIDTLQNDRLARDPDRKGLPSALKESFNEWLDDSYGPAEREHKMAPENQDETERNFLEHVVDAGPGDYEGYALAKATLADTQLAMAGAVGVKNNKEKTGLSDNRPMNDMEAIEAIYHLIGKDVNAAFASKGALNGSGAWGRDAKTGQAVIRIAANALDPMSVAYHESMHEFFQRALDDKNLGGIHETLRKVASSKLVLRQMQRHFAAEAEVLKDIESDPAERVAYMFQLWAAGKLHVGPETETVFRKIINMVKKVLGMMTTDQKALEIMQEFAAGNMSDRGAMARVLNTQEARGAYLRKVGTAMKPVVERGAEIVGFAENILADSGNPALIRIGKQFNNKTGSQGDKQGLLSAEAQAQNKYMNEFAKALRHGDKEDVRLAMEGLQKKEDHADPIVRKIQEGVKAVFKRMYDYMEGAGVMRWDEKAGKEGKWVKVKKIDDYRLPVSWDASKIIANSEEFKALLFKHHEEALNDIASKANAEVAAKKGAGQYTASQEKLANPDGTAVTAENVAEALVQRLISTNGQVEFKETENALGFSPFMKSVNERSLHWIDHSVFHEFQEKDMALILTTYVGQATKRAEYSRRFGPDGGELQAGMEEAWHHEIDKIMKEKHKVEGAVIKAREAASAVTALGKTTTWEEQLGKLAGDEALGKEITLDAAKNLEPARRAVMAMEGTLGHDISPLARKVNAYSIVYQNMRLLGYAMFSNIVDPLGIVVRGGEFKDAYATFKRGMRDVGREWGALTGLREAKESDRDEAVDVAEMIGTVDSSAFMSIMGNMYGSQYLGKFAREANDSFFRWNGMEAFNKAMRVGATQAAINFIKRHHEKPNKHTERYFKELNLDPKDVKIGEDGRLNVENPAVQQAVMRWVDGAQLRPNAAMRPTMASDPHYASFYHLKQFMYAMQAVILKRVQVEIKNGNTDPLMLMFAGYVPVMLAADAAKGLLQVATGGGAPVWEHEGVAGVVSHGVQRAGLLGIGQMAVDVAEYGPLGLGGPTVEQVGSAAVDPIGKTVAEAVAVGPTNMMLRGTNWDN